MPPSPQPPRIVSRTTLAGRSRSKNSSADRRNRSNQRGSPAAGDTLRMAPVLALSMPLLAAATPADLVAARSQMALTLGFHIVLACLGVALPAIMLIAEARGLRRGDQDALLLARRWSSVVAVTFAVGAVSGTVLSFELGLLWPGLMGQYGAAFGIPFAVRGHLLLRRGDLRRDLHLRLGPPVAARPFSQRHPHRDRRPRRDVLGRGRERLDESTGRFHDGRRRADQRGPARSR